MNKEEQFDLFLNDVHSFIEENINNKDEYRFFVFDQNNSGGRFQISDKLAKNVFIFARNADEANEYAENIGIYFNGCAKQMDCECCGDRWHPAYDDYSIDVNEVLELIRIYANSAIGLISLIDVIAIHLSTDEETPIYKKFDFILKD